MFFFFFAQLTVFSDVYNSQCEGMCSGVQSNPVIEKIDIL